MKAMARLPMITASSQPTVGELALDDPRPIGQGVTSATSTSR